MRTILIMNEARDNTAYSVQVSDEEFAALERANLIYIDIDKAGEAVTHIGIDLLRMADALSDISPANFKELVPIYVERPVRETLVTLLANIQGISYSKFVEMSIGSLARGVTRRAFEKERETLEKKARDFGIGCTCPRELTGVSYKRNCPVHGEWLKRSGDAMKVVPRVAK